MREIKVKAWNKLTKKFTPTNMLGLQTIIDAIKWRGDGVMRLENTDWHEFIQYTGCFDKNGKEIHDGDIPEEMSWITWCDKCCSFELFIVGEGCANCSGDISWQEVVDNKNIEIIGNIYENPELLENRG